MALLTPEIIKALPPLHSTERISLKDKIVICKFFTPWENWTWFVFEGKKREESDYLFYGIVHGYERECGYFSLSKWGIMKGYACLKIERDLAVFKQPYHTLVK